MEKGYFKWFDQQWMGFIISKRFYDNNPDMQHNNEITSDHYLPYFFRFLGNFDHSTIKYGMEKRL